MDASSLLKARDPDLASSFIALQRAAKIARETAIQTQTAIVIMRNDKLVYLSGKELQTSRDKKLIKISVGVQNFEPTAHNSSIIPSCSNPYHSI